MSPKPDISGCASGTCGTCGPCTAKKSKDFCHDYSVGKCTRGAKCKYRHDGAAPKKQVNALKDAVKQVSLVDVCVACGRRHYDTGAGAKCVSCGGNLGNPALQFQKFDSDAASDQKASLNVEKSWRTALLMINTFKSVQHHGSADTFDELDAICYSNNNVKFSLQDIYTRLGLALTEFVVQVRERGKPDTTDPNAVEFPGNFLFFMEHTHSLTSPDKSSPVDKMMDRCVNKLHSIATYLRGQQRRSKSESWRKHALVFTYNGVDPRTDFLTPFCKSADVVLGSNVEYLKYVVFVWCKNLDFHAGVQRLRAEVAEAATATAQAAALAAQAAAEDAIFRAAYERKSAQQRKDELISMAMDSMTTNVEVAKLILNLAIRL